ncbi:MAG: hypothetical protein M3273_00160 [Actinomycetota bacterium]|nr:hypothetical protein [Actinomycetota bacterium]
MDALRNTFLLLAYRTRPLRPVTLAVTLAGAYALGTAMIPAHPARPPQILIPQDVSHPLMLVAVALALGAAFVGGRDVDAAEPILRAAPAPYWRTVLIRMTLWGAACAPPVSVLAARGAGALDLPDGVFRSHGLVFLLFAGSIAFASSRILGPLIGGGAALAVVLGLGAASGISEDFPLRLLADPGSQEWIETSRRLTVGAALVCLSVLWVLRRTGSRLVPGVRFRPRVRGAGSPRPASRVRSRRARRR